MANFPTSVSTNANLYIAVNGLQTTLSSSITNSVTTIPLTSTTGFPTTGLVTIENNEVVSYTGVSGGNLTGCTRGADGTTALAHNSGVTVGATIVAAHHNLLKDELIAVETSLGAGYLQASANTASAVVQRDGSGNFAAGTITASLTGLASLNLPLTGGTLTGDLTMDNQHAIIFKEPTGTGTTSVTVKAPATVTSSYTIQLPPAVASAGQVLTDVVGNGVLSWATASAGITQLTGDVTAGPGSGSQAATVANVSGQTAGVVATGAQNVLNFLINGGFEIWQRGTSFSSPSNTTYLADRWQMTYGGSGTFTVSRDTGVDTSGGNNIRSTYCMKFVVSTVNTMDSCRVIQRIENLDGFGAASVCVSVKIKTSVASKVNVTIIGGAQSGSSVYHSGSGNWETLTATIATVNSGTNLRVAVGFNDFAPTATTFYIDNAMFCYGSTGTAFVSADPEMELARCQRYYEKSYAQGTDPGTSVGSSAAVTAVQTSTNRTVSSYHFFKVEKRVQPTIRTWQLNGTSGNIDWLDTGGTSHAVTTDIAVHDVKGLNLRQTTSATYVYADFGYDADAEF